MQTVLQILGEKRNHQIWSVRPDQTVIEALELMAEKNIGAVLVMDGEKLAGIFSERDYARKGILQGRKAKSTPVTEVMTPGVFVITPAQSTEDCMKLMSNKKIRHLPVVDEGRVVGLLSIGDIVNSMLNEQENHIKTLEMYISGY